MKILFDLNHPAHVHLFKNFIFYLKEKGHFVFVTTRNKDVCHALLQHYGIDYISVTSAKKGFWSLLKELIVKDYKLLKLNKKYKFNLAFGCSPSIAHLSLVSKVKSFNFSEDDDDYTSLYTWLAYPFTTKIINHNNVRFKRFGKNRIFHNSYEKLAYLHPNNFKPNSKILLKYGLKKYDYILLRKVSLNAHHDILAKGISSELWNKIRIILKNKNLVVSNESNKEHQIDPWDMHDILAYAKFVITDSLSLSVESSLLGVPVIRYNSFENKSTVLNELKNKYGLAIGYNSLDESVQDKFINEVKRFLADPNLNKVWQERRQKMLKDKEDLTSWIIKYFEENLNLERRA